MLRGKSLGFAAEQAAPYSLLKGYANHYAPFDSAQGAALGLAERSRSHRVSQKEKANYSRRRQSGIIRSNLTD